MASTGLMAWFQVTVTRLLPGWWINVALTIHLYEAILATLAVLIWHFYQVVFDPDVYPMNWAWWNGRMSLERYKDEHSLDSETIWEAMRQEPDVVEREQDRVGHEPESRSENHDPPPDVGG